MTNTDAYGHVRGESVYLDDIPLIYNTLFACVFDSPVAHGILKSVDLSQALKLKGVVSILLALDIPGVNQIGGIVPDEPLLAEGHVHFQGMPIALVLAETEEIAQAAAKKIKVVIDPLEIITDPRIAFEKNELIIPPKKFKMGDSDLAFKDCVHVFSGRADVNGQEHLYIETQGAYSVPMEGGGIKIYSSTQGPTAVQRTVARVTGLPMHRIEVEVGRLGGGFGGKEDQASSWACLCALGTLLTNRPVKYSLHRMEDMRMTGKRHPYSADFKIGLNKDLNIQAYEVVFYQNAGAAADLSPAVLERTLFHCTNSYFIPHVTATAYSCRTNLPPNTAFRGFGGPQGMFVIESAITHAAEKLKISPSVIQRKNLITPGEEFPYGQKAESEAVTTWVQADSYFDFEKIISAAHDFNLKNKNKKRGVALMPICFGISFTKTLMNQARALVHVYTDGSVAVSTGAVEMGQGVNTKMQQVAAETFSISSGQVKVHSTNTLRVANTSPSAASATADLNGKAVLLACEAILNRLKIVAAEELNIPFHTDTIKIENGFVFHQNIQTKLDWKTLVNAAFVRRVNLSEHAHYATPGVHFDWTISKGHPFSYHVYGTAIIQVTLDCLRGIYEVDFVKGVHDYGKSMNTLIDQGQIEGGIVQGLGWMTMEELVYDVNGKLRSNALSSYKIPDIYSAPRTIDIQPLATTRENLAIFSSKAVGEPPLMYGIGAYFAIRDAIRAFNTNASPEYDAPFTPEKVLMALYDSEINKFHSHHSSH
ncbi:MAG: molybdopterin-dependent oxidoreductase [Saprospiraceae bacterium]|uniref:Molybdopterin-dependent oxidoreductase n=1 Tax=Candidatus Opimibacter skivensis TaxID=2982028 RepID=A0A9D7XQA4_9BACT|nr:molybdopterin-dependent oxidoreductase [Candidatus Opimibacter skivensis]